MLDDPEGTAECVTVSMFRMWIRLSGISRATSTNGRRSFSVTSAVLVRRLSERPVAMAPRVRIEHGMTSAMAALMAAAAVVLFAAGSVSV